MTDENGGTGGLPSKFNVPEFLMGRTGKVIFSLLGRVVEPLDARLERPTKKIRAKTEREIKRDNKIDDALTDRFLDDQEMMDSLYDMHRKKLGRQYKNISNITEGAMKVLGENGTEGSKKAEATEEEVSEDWIEKFRKYAQDISDENIQQIWSKVLAGEIEEPGQFSFPTLHTISLMDQKTAHLISKYINHDASGMLLVDPKPSKGYDMDLIALENMGIVSGVTIAGLHRSFSVSQPTKVIHHELAGFYLEFEFEEEIDSLKLNCILLTRVGRELAKLLPSITKSEVIEAVKSRCGTKGLKAVRVIG